MLNIPSTVIDPNFRYKMPKMQLKQQSKGNGIKTNIVNLQDVAKNLNTDPSYILKWFGFQKGSQIYQKGTANKSDKAKSNANYIIQGSFTYDQLLKVLDKFIQKYILCPKCKLPQLSMYISNDKIHGKCDCCPFYGQLDNSHKVVSYILKNPPKLQMQPGKATKKEKKGEQKQKQKQQKNSKQTKPSQTQKKTQQTPQGQVQKQAAQLFDAENLLFGTPQLQQLVQYTRKYISNRKNVDFDIASAQTIDNLKKLKLKKTLMAYVIFNALFTVNIAKQAAEGAQMYNKLMKRLVKNTDESNQIQTLLNVQYLFLQVHKQQDFTIFIPTILHILIQSKILSSQFVVDWGHKKFPQIDKFFLFNQARNQKFLKMAAELIGFLEEDGEDEDGS